LADVLTKGGYNGSGMLTKANAPAIKTRLRELTAEARALGICGVPTYRVLRETGVGKWEPMGGLVWGQDEMGVVEDLITGWDPESSDALAKPKNADDASNGLAARL
jgi:2-hydroxychromene-2-carboxylate isomerase